MEVTHSYSLGSRERFLCILVLCILKNDREKIVEMLAMKFFICSLQSVNLQVAVALLKMMACLMMRTFKSKGEVRESISNISTSLN